MKTPSILNLILFASAFGTVISSVPSQAQIAGPAVAATVPFGFELGARHFAPGTYQIGRVAQGILSVRSRTNTGMAATRWETSKHSNGIPKVVFHKYGNQYFLREVWPSFGSDHLECTESKQERQVRRAEVAMNRSGPTNLELALLQAPRPQP